MIIPVENIDIPKDTFRLFKFRTKKQRDDALLRLEQYSQPQRLKTEPLYRRLDIFLIIKHKDLYRLYPARTIGLRVPVLSSSRQPFSYYALASRLPEYIMKTVIFYGMLYIRKQVSLFCTVETEILDAPKTLADLKDMYTRLDLYSQVYIDSLVRDTRYQTDFPLKLVGK